MSKDKLPKLNPLEQIVADFVLRKSKLSYLRGYNAGLEAAHKIWLEAAKSFPTVEEQKKELRNGIELLIAKHLKKIM